MICVCRVPQEQYFPLKELSTALFEEVSKVQGIPVLPAGFIRKGIKLATPGNVVLQIGIAGGSLTVSPFETLEHADLFRLRFFESDWYKAYKEDRKTKFLSGKEKAKTKPRKGSYAEYAHEQAQHAVELRSLVEQLSAEFFELRKEHSLLLDRVAKLENTRVQRLEEILARPKEK